jgi:uncharacterized protein
MKLENTFEVPTSAEDAWTFLNDMPRVIPCMPGAELMEIIDESHWTAAMRVKVGPVALQFNVDIELEEADEGSRRVVISAAAREMRGRGRANASIGSSLVEIDTGTQVNVSTDLNLQGAIGQYGRSIVADVSTQLTDEFAACLSSNIAADAQGDTTGSSGRMEPGGASPGPTTVAPKPVQPINGVRIGMTALWRQLVALVRRRTRRG